MGWEGRIAIENRTMHLGLFESEEEAARAYDQAVQIHGSNLDLPLNFPPPPAPSPVRSADSRMTPSYFTPPRGALSPSRETEKSTRHGNVPPSPPRPQGAEFRSTGLK